MTLVITSVNVGNYFTPESGSCSWGPRIITDFELIYLIKGKALYQEKNRTAASIKEGEILLIPPGAEHTFSCEPKSLPVISCIHFSARRLKKVPDVFHAETDTEIHNLFKKTAAEFEHLNEFHRQMAMHLVSEIFLRIQRLKNSKTHLIPLHVKKVINYIDNNFMHEIKRSQFADCAGVSPEHLNHLFRRFLKTTPGAYLEKIRIRNACRLLRTGVKVLEAARLSGYNDPLYFSKVFRKAMGMPPKKWSSAI